MLSEPDETIRRLQHEKHVWRGIAIGLAATLVLALTLGGIAGIFLARRSQQERMRAEDARMQALQERNRAEAAERRAAEKQKAQRP